MPARITKSNKKKSRATRRAKKKQGGCWKEGPIGNGAEGQNNKKLRGHEGRKGFGVVINSDDDLNKYDSKVVVYTAGLYDRGWPEFLATNVPRSHAECVAGAMRFLASRMEEGHAVVRGHRLASHGLHLTTIWVETEPKRVRARIELMRQAHPDSKVLILSPEYANCETYGSRPPAPEGRTELRDRIFEKLRQERSFIRHVDGNVLNNAMDNLKNVGYFQAFSNPDWQVDWVCFVREKDARYVKKNMGHFAELFSPVDVAAPCVIAWQ